jgi:hypothetical protein
MSFNTSNIQADTFTGVYSISAPVHYVEGIPISNNAGNLKLGNADNAVVECLELESGTSVTAPLGEFDTVQLTNLISKAGEGEPILALGPLDLGYNALLKCTRIEVGDISGLNGQLLGAGFGGGLEYKNPPPLVSTWSTNDATSDVNMENFGINNLQTLSLAYGATGADQQVLSVDSNGQLFWKTDANDVANWATFPANSTVDFNTQSITGSYADGVGINVLTGLLMNNNGIGQASMVSGTACNFETVQTGRIYPYEQVGQPILIEGSFNMQNYGIDNLQSLTLANSTSGTEDQVLSVDANGNLKWKDDISGDVSQWATFDAVQDVNMNDFVLNSVGGISGSGGAINLLSGIDAGNNNIGGVNVLECKRIECEYRPENTYYVSANGDDSYARGNIESPFQTIQQAITFAENYTGNNDYKYIVVLPGNYVENLTITKKVHLIGMAQSPYSASVGCSISGSITINVGSNGGDMFNNAVNISGFLIGSQVSFISTQNSILNMENCYIYSDDNASGRGLYFNPSCANSRLRLTNTIIISGGSSGLDPLVEITSVSQVVMNNCYFSAKGLQNVLKFSGTATCDTINTVKFESGNSGANIPAIVEITATVSATYTFSNCGFIYASATNKSANAQASGIYSNSSTGNNRIVALYCSFFLTGTSSALNYAIQDAYHGGASQMIVLYYMNGASLQNAFSIRGNNNQTKFQLQIVS